MRQTDNTLDVSVKAEYDKAKVIVAHTPEEELFYGCLQGEAALFEKTPFDRFKAIDEHIKYVQRLRDEGINVVLLRDILLEGTVDDKGNKVDSPETVELTRLAEGSLFYSYPIELPLDRLAELKASKSQTLAALHPFDLVRIVLLKPRVRIGISDEGNSELIAESYSLQPVMNLHFLRDQQITTDRGIVIGRMNSSQRRVETEITTFAFRKLGIRPRYVVQENGRLEGGDFIPCGNYAFIGQGLRTNSEGIRQLLDHNVFGYEEIAVVKDPYKQQDEMHLDTYFNVTSPNKAVVLEDRVDHYNEKGDSVRADPKRRTVVDVYKREGSLYIRVRENVPFQEYLKEKGFVVGKPGEDNSLITLSKEEQLNYGINFLTIRENTIITVEGVSQNYLQKMNGITVIEIDFSTFVKTFGAPHCATQVICRE